MDSVQMWLSHDKGVDYIYFKVMQHGQTKSITVYTMDDYKMLYNRNGD